MTKVADDHTPEMEANGRKNAEVDRKAIQAVLAETTDAHNFCQEWKSEPQRTRIRELVVAAGILAVLAAWEKEYRWRDREPSLRWFSKKDAAKYEKALVDCANVVRRLNRTFFERQYMLAAPVLWRLKLLPVFLEGRAAKLKALAHDFPLTDIGIKPLALDAEVYLLEWVRLNRYRGFRVPRIGSVLGAFVQAYSSLTPAFTYDTLSLVKRSQRFWKENRIAYAPRLLSFAELKATQDISERQLQKAIRLPLPKEHSWPSWTPTMFELIHKTGSGRRALGDAMDDAIKI